MKKYFSALLALTLLCSCAARRAESSDPVPAVSEVASTAATPSATEATATTADAIARAIVDSQPDPEGYAAQTGENLELYLTGLYGLEDYIGMEAAVYAASGVDPREVAVVRLAGMTSEGAPVMEALEEYRKNRLGDFLGYSPDQAALVEGGEVSAGWSCVALLICEDMDKARTAFETAAGQASVYVPAEAAGTPEPAPTATPTPGVSSVPTAAPTPAESPAPAETVAPVGLSAEETRWFIPFDPPNEFDMTPYDISSVLTAWETGDESGLGETDAAILGRAKAVLETCGISEEMTGFEKELALHDWLTANCAYDQTTHDPHTPIGREHNLDPYGTLVSGYGICLGYAAAFQLLMDMAGVECVTVVGATNESRQDHAWNMVRLEGEWYCVDVTWDDPTGGTSHHRYFNVTSEYMRSTNHQWDYRNVPEATADRFRWDGTGPMPQ